jgi:hypothetical protein
VTTIDPEAEEMVIAVAVNVELPSRRPSGDEVTIEPVAADTMIECDPVVNPVGSPSRPVPASSTFVSRPNVSDLISAVASVMLVTLIV